VMQRLYESGATSGRDAVVERADPGVVLTVDGRQVGLSLDAARLVYVTTV
jgi:hypothetical protein